MEKSAVTASAIISFAEKLENDSFSFYKAVAETARDRKDQETFLAFAKESEKHKLLITRTYQETISDALEAGFSFRSLNLNDYLIETAFTEDVTYSDVLKRALELEEKAIKFYLDMAEMSKSLLATIPWAFRKVAERRKRRKVKLELLINSLK